MLAATGPLRVLGLQVELLAGQTEANLARAEALIRANPGHRLYVLPELSSHGYCDEVLSQLDPARPERPAQDAESGSVTAFFCRLARDVDAHISYGFLRDAGAGRTCICQAVVDPRGQLVLAYDKMHLCDMGDCSEVAHGCSPGEGELGVFECDGVLVGVTICYDLRFPELYRALAWDAGCDLILHPAAFVRDATFPMYHQVGRRREEASVAGSTPLAALKASTFNQRLSQPTPSPSRPSSLLRLAPSRMASTCSLSATRASASARRSRARPGSATFLASPRRWRPRRSAPRRACSLWWSSLGTSRPCAALTPTGGTCTRDSGLLARPGGSTSTAREKSGR